MPTSTLTPEAYEGHPRYANLIAAALLIVLAILLIASARQESQTFDESTHLGAGVAYWKHSDFGNNPEHPPLVKLLAALPLLSLHLQEPAPSHIPYFKAQENLYGTNLLYSEGGDASRALFRGRLVIMLLSVGLGLLLFLAAREIFDPLAAIITLSLYVFQPLLLGNGNIVTTDMALACFLFASTYTFYRFSDKPTFGRFAVCALAVCLTVTSKHSGILVIPTLCLLALADAVLPSREQRLRKKPHHRRWILLATATLLLFSYVALWAVYGFNFRELHITPPMPAYAAGLPHPLQKALLLWLDRHRILPEPYLYGWVDILLIPSTRPSFLLGHIYSTPQRLFFPAAFAMKSTLALLILLLLLPLAPVSDRRRELVFIVLPGLFFFAVCIASMMNGGTRYLIPVYPYCVLLAGVAGGHLLRRSSLPRFAVATLLLFGIISTLNSYPNFLSYSNELMGGPAKTYHFLTDSDGDWGQGLKWTSAYMARHPDPSCWFDSSGNPGVSLVNFNIPCKQLLSGFKRMIGSSTPPIPASISGTVLVSSTDIDGAYWGPGDLNPYQVFRDRKPDAVIADTILVYHGSFSVPHLAAETNAVAATDLLHQGRLPEALAFAQTAATQAPASADVQATLGQILLASGHLPEGQQAMKKGMMLAQTMYPEYQAALLRQMRPMDPHP